MPTPFSLGYRMPAEFEKQTAVWIAWPHNEETWPGMLQEVEKSFIEFAKVMHSGEKICILSNGESEEKNIAEKLKLEKIFQKNILFYRIKTVDSWIRDYGPIFVANGKKRELAMVKWEFNAWGNKYEDLKEDERIAYEMNEKLKLKIFEPGMVLEGGSIEVNGKGTLITTEQCLLNKNRNPEMKKEETEEKLKQFFGATNILWLKNGIEGDDTDGHIDDTARFVNENTVVCAYEENKNDENYGVLRENYELLLRMRNENGKKLKVIKLPMPEPVIIGGRRMAASYANFYIGNKAVAVPVFGSKNDMKAIAILQKLFPQRKVIGIDCRALVYGYGALHCCTQQQPAV